MEYSSSCDDEDFIMKFSDDECSNKMDYADNYGIIDDTQRDSKGCESSQLKFGFPQPKQENYCEFNDAKFNQFVKKKNGVVVNDENRQKFASQYLTSPAVSPKKQQGISQNFEKDNISVEIVNFSKLVNQLLNAKVVIEKMCVNAGTNKQPATHRASSNTCQFRDLVQLYCSECQTVIVGSDGGTVKKSCSKCESLLKYMCSKCNNKHYKTYESLSRHSKACELTDSTLEELQPSNFLVKETEIDFSKTIIRYCSNCNKIDSICGKWIKKICRNCDSQLLFQCSKCKAQYNASSALLYHMQSQCYPSLYKCRQCDFLSLPWENMRQHVIKVHLREHSNFEPPNQLLNAKAVLRIFEETPVEDTVSRNVENHTKVGLLDEKKLEGETNCNENVRLYCHTCKKTQFARIEDVLAKNCSNCKTAMAFSCTKCNVKHYKRYPYLQIHLDRCKGSVDVIDKLEDDIDRTKSNMEDKNKANIFLDRSKFIAKKFQSVNSTEKWSRHCPKCGLVTASHNDRRCVCSERLLYMCKKCNVKCSNYAKWVYHAENYCFPTRQYKCTHCEFSKTSWKKMKVHFKITHANLPLIKCEFCSYKTNIKCNLKRHLRSMHDEIDKIFQCGYCSYSTKFECNLHRHEKLNH